MINETDFAGPEHLDPSFVAGYEQKQGNPDPAAELDVLAAHGLGPRCGVLDMGAGTGIFALAAARRFRRVIAVDVSPAMVEVRERTKRLGLANLECVQAGFLSYAHKGRLVDAVYTRNALHHLPDFWKALALNRLARVIRTGGVLRLHDLIFDFRPGEETAVLNAWLDGAARDARHGYTRDDFAEHIRTEHSTFRWLLEPMLESSGFDILTADFSASIYGAYTCIKR